MVLDLLNISIEKNIQIYYLLAYLRNLAKLADQAIIEKIKDAWITRWETKMATLIHNAKWQNDQQVGEDGLRSLRILEKDNFCSLQLKQYMMSIDNKMLMT